MEYIKGYRKNKTDNYFLLLNILENGFIVLYSFDKGIYYATKNYLDNCTETYNKNIIHLYNKYKNLYGEN